MLSRLCITLLALTMVGCTTASEPASDETTAGIGNIIQIGNIKVRPDNVAEDSRCPADVDCYWPGRILLDVTIFKDKQSSAIQLSSIEPALLASGKLSLVSVAPEARSDGKIRASDYRFEFDFQPAP